MIVAAHVVTMTGTGQSVSQEHLGKRQYRRKSKLQPPPALQGTDSDLSLGVMLPNLRSGDPRTLSRAKTLRTD